MSPMQLTAFANEIFEKSNLDSMSRKALDGIVKGEKSAQGILKAHIEDIVRFLLKQLKWVESEALDEGDQD